MLGFVDLKLKHLSTLSLRNLTQQNPRTRNGIERLRAERNTLRCVFFLCRCCPTDFKFQRQVQFQPTHTSSANLTSSTCSGRESQHCVCQTLTVQDCSSTENQVTKIKKITDFCNSFRQKLRNCAVSQKIIDVLCTVAYRILSARAGHFRLG